MVCKKHEKGHRLQGSKKTLRDRFQVAAFMAVYKGHILRGLTELTAFGLAVLETSDKVYSQLPEGSAEKWADFITTST